MAAAIGAVPAAAAMDPALAPFVTPGTLLIVKADITRFDAAAADAALVQAAQAALGAVNCRPLVAVLDHHVPEAQRWLTDFRRAGGKKIYAVAFLGSPASIPGVLIVPLSATADPGAIAALLVSGRIDGADHRDDAGPFDDNNHPVGLEAIVINGAVVFGATPQVEKMKAARPAERPMFEDAMTALGDAPFQIIFSPSIALQLVAGDLLPEKLPDEVGGGSPALLIDTVAWVALGGTAPPHPSLQLLIQCKDSGGAQDYADLFAAVLANAGHDAKLATALKPTMHDDCLSVTVDAGTMSGLLLPRLLDAVGLQRLDRLSGLPPPATQPSNEN
jgi:hypothetical protein